MGNVEQTKKGRGRPKGSKNLPKDKKYPDPQAENGKVEPGHNQPHVAKEPLTDEQLQSLFFQHKEEYERALKAKKTADADLKVVAKRLKAEGTKVSDVKLAIKLEDPEGSVEMRARLEREVRVARWMNAPVGTQVDFLDDVDRTPIDERVYEEGKRAGLRGDKGNAPRHIPGNLISKYMEGWNAGQEVLAGRIKQQRQEDGDDFDKNPPASQAPNDDLDDDLGDAAT